MNKKIKVTKNTKEINYIFFLIKSIIKDMNQKEIEDFFCEFKERLEIYIKNCTKLHIKKEVIQATNN